MVLVENSHDKGDPHLSSYFHPDRSPAPQRSWPSIIVETMLRPLGCVCYDDCEHLAAFRDTKQGGLSYDAGVEFRIAGPLREIDRIDSYQSANRSRPSNLLSSMDVKVHQQIKAIRIPHALC